MSQLSITQRLITLVTVPLVFTGGFAAWALTTTGRQAVSASRLTALVTLAGEAGVLADRLQQERAAATALLLGGSPFDQLEQYERVTGATDEAIANYRHLRADVPASPTATQTLLDRVDDQMSRLPTLRDDVRESPTVALSAVTFAYRITIADLVSLRESAAQAEGGSADLVGQLRAASALSHATEFVSLMQIQVLQATAAGGATAPADQQAIMASLNGYREATATFDELAQPQWQDWLDHALTGPDVLAAQRWEDLVTRTPSLTAPAIDPAQWTKTTSTQISRLHEVELSVDAAVHDEVSKVYAEKVRSVAVEAVLVVLALMAAVVLAIRQSRSMIRRLRGLAAAARTTAFVSLPHTVERLRRMGSQTVDPEDFANEAEAPLADVGADEIADVSKAFLSVHRQAIRTAADLANMRAGLGQILLHLARRNQRLVGVLIRELDGAERGEGDPDRLATLFRLDQLATRMGRYTDNLLVVGGQTASRVDTPDADLDTVLRGAQSKIEHYPRVRIAAVDERLMVRGSAVHDMMNLLAELLDNATQFSPPDSTVDIVADQVPAGVVILVRDIGVGLPGWRLEAFNQSFAAPPAIDVSSIRSMGLTVVAHIAAWHGIDVRLRPGPQYGTVVEIVLPATICRARTNPVGRRLDPLRLSPTATGAVGWPPRPAPPQTDPPIFQAVAIGFAGFVDHSSGAPRWRGAADEGWAAAARAAAPGPQRMSGTGLPRRPPLANLVPGSVPGGPTGVGAVDHRDPAGVAAAVAAFASGNASSRAMHLSQSPKEHR